MIKVGQIVKIMVVVIAVAFSSFFMLFGLDIFWRQYVSQSFPKTEGRIVSAHLMYSGMTKRGGMIYKPELTYTYTVSGREYTGQRYRYDDEPQASDLVPEIVASHPTGSRVKVYFNAGNPGDAVLAPEVLTADVTGILIPSAMLSFSLLILLKTLRDMPWSGGDVPLAGGVRIISELTATRVRMTRCLPGTLGLLTAGISSLGGAIFLGIVFHDSPVPATWFVLGGMIGAGIVAYLWQHQKLASGRLDLVINSVNRTVELPLTYGRHERRPRPISSITAVSVGKVRYGNRSRKTYTYAPALKFNDGTAERLTELTRERAEGIAAWLREKLGLPA